MQAFQLRNIARPKTFLVRCFSREKNSLASGQNHN